MTACRACGAAITFEETKNGKLTPVNADGVSHFATCPQAERFKKPPLPEDECHACGSKEIERLPGKGPHHGAIRCLDCGVRRWLRKPQEVRS